MSMFIIPIIVGIITGSIVGSWLWAIGAFSICIFLEVLIVNIDLNKNWSLSDINLIELILNLVKIGKYKNELPSSLQGLCDSLGLYVQLETSTKVKRLQAGEIRKKKLDAKTKIEDLDTANWKVTTYKSGRWEDLIYSTLEIVTFLNNENIQGHLPAEKQKKLDDAVNKYKDFSDNSLINALNEKVKKKEEYKSYGFIQQYDKILLKDIKKIESYVSKSETLSKEYMRAYGATEKVIDKVANKAHNEGKPLSLIGDGTVVYEVVLWLKDMAPLYKSFSFRIHGGSHFEPFTSISTCIHIIKGHSKYRLNTIILNDDERKDYAIHWNTLFKKNYVVKQVPIVKRYPTIEFMSFVETILAKYKGNNILTTDEIYDEKMSAVFQSIDNNS